MVKKKKRSPTTTKVNIRRLRKFEEVSGIKRKDLIKMKPKKIKSALENFVGDMDGHAPSYIHSVLKSVYVYLDYKDVIYKKIETPKGSSTTPTLRKEKVPTQEQLKKIILNAPHERDRVMVSLMAYTGIRPQVMGNHDGSDGLRLGDIEDLDIKKIKYQKLPVKINISESLSKTDHEYFVFLCEEGANTLIEYLNNRINKGEILTMDSAVIRSDYDTNNNRTPFVVTKTISDGIRKSIRKAGFEWRPYVLRRYFTVRMMNAEYKQLMPRSFIQFLAGHSGDMLQRYMTNKDLPEAEIEDMREAYKKSENFLITDKSYSKDEIEATNKKIDDLQTKSKINEEMMFDQIEKIKKENDELRRIINTLVTEKNVIMNSYTEYYEQKEGKMNTITIKK